MSTLTKILIVLLTLSSIFLCGIVVTYVANADNYKQQATSVRSQVRASREKEKDSKKQLNENVARIQQVEENLSREITSLKSKLTELQGNLRNAEREKSLLLQKVNSWASIVKDFRETNEDQGELLNDTLNELSRVQAEQIKQQKQFNETTDLLIEKMAIIETLQTQNKRLLEEKTELQKTLDRQLRPLGEVSTAAEPVTPTKDIVRPGRTAVSDIALQGSITTVDLKNSMAEISIGAADGVKPGMKFHVTRGNEFICDILILDDVEAEKAVGILELLQQQQPPKLGDKVSTNL